MLATIVTFMLACSAKANAPVAPGIPEIPEVILFAPDVPDTLRLCITHPSMLGRPLIMCLELGELRKLLAKRRLA